MAASAPTLRTVPLSEEAIPRLVEIDRASNSSPWSERSFRNELDHPHGLFRMALVEGQIVGFACAWMIVDELHITNLAVDPEYRRQGIARRMLAELLREGTERGMVVANLEVRVSNEPAQTLYKNAGFEARGVRKKYYTDNQEDALIMWKDDMP